MAAIMILTNEMMQFVKILIAIEIHMARLQRFLGNAVKKEHILLGQADLKKQCFF